MKSNTSKSGSNKKLKITLVIIFITGLLGTWLSASFFSGNFYAGSRSETLQTIQSLIDSVQINTAAQSGFYDEGCNTNGSVGIQTRLSCNAFGFKIATSNDIANDLKKLEEQIKSQGFQRHLLIGQSQEDFNAILTGEKEGAMRYSKTTDTYIIADLTFYKNASTNNDRIISDLIKSDKISDTKSEEEYFYGITISANYYSCSEVMLAPCLLQPSL